MEKLVHHQAYIKVRCPSCFKLFSVQPKEIKVKQPKFKCMSCEQGFTFDFPECLGQPEFTARAIDLSSTSDQGESLSSSRAAQPAKEESTSVRVCPKCEAKNEASNTECFRCGVIFEKVPKVSVEVAKLGTPELKKEWQRVLADYNNKESHQNFISLCLRQNHADYAASRYQMMCEINAADDVAKHYREAIKAWAQGFLPERKKKAQRVGSFGLTLMIVLFASFLIGLGYGIPHQRNLMGVGAAILFIMLVARLSKRRWSF